MVEFDLKYPLLEHQLKYFNETFPGVMHPCPYNSMRFYNATYGPKITAKYTEGSTTYFPNGIYRFSIVVLLDENQQFFVTYWAEIYFHYRNFIKLM